MAASVVEAGVGGGLSLVCRRFLFFLEVTDVGSLVWREMSLLVVRGDWREEEVSVGVMVVTAASVVGVEGNRDD